MADSPDVLAQLGIKISTLIAGFSGGIAYYYFEGSKRIERSYVGRAVDTLVSGTIGSFMAVYLAPLALEYFHVKAEEVNIQTGAGFLVGLTGIHLGHGLIRLAAAWSKNPFVITRKLPGGGPPSP